MDEADGKRRKVAFPGMHTEYIHMQTYMHIYIQALRADNVGSRTMLRGGDRPPGRKQMVGQ